MRSAASDDHAAWINALGMALGHRTATYKDEQGVTRRVTLRIAHSAFLQQGYPFEQAYLDALAERFGVGVRLTDFRGDPGASLKTINDWVRTRTTGRIPRLLAKSDLDARTRFVLVNAIYLKAAWERIFDPDLTVPAVFTLADGSRIKVPTMVGPKGLNWVRYASGTGWRGVEIPYIGHTLAMTVILPGDLAAFEKSMTPQRLAAIVGGVAKAPMFRTNRADRDHSIAYNVALPKFSFQTRTDLAEALAAAGMPRAFDPAGADFTGIVDPATSGEPGLYIQKTIHQAMIEVDEKGTTAAASTAVIGGAGGGPETVVFEVDRPFIFVIRDIQTGAILFMGRVMDPRAH